MKRAAWWLKSLYELQLRTIQASPRLFCDETPMPVLDPGRHRTRICQFWAHAMDDRPWGGPSPPAVAYVFADGRGTKRDRRATDRLRGHSAGGWLCRLQGAGRARSWRRDPSWLFVSPMPDASSSKVYKTMQSPFAREVIERLQAVYAIEGRVRGTSAEQRLAAPQH